MIKQKEQKEILDRFEQIETKINEVNIKINDIRNQLERDKKIIQPVSFLLAIFYTVVASIVVANLYYIKDMFSRNQNPGFLETGTFLFLLILLLVLIAKAPVLLNIFIKIAEKKGI